MFSRRTHWHRQSNKLTMVHQTLMRSGRPIYDLTISNPTVCGFNYPREKILESISQPRVLTYQPDPHGHPDARAAIGDYYKNRGAEVSPGRIFLTSGTSEAYSIILKLLCDFGDEILVPSPSYPLFNYLAQLGDVRLRSYHLRYDHEWHVDLDSLSHAIGNKTRAIVLIHPHNPTGAFLKESEYSEILTLARNHGLALIVDEVFFDYAFEGDPRRARCTPGDRSPLTFTLNGVSKIAGLPQIKVGWVVLTGEAFLVEEAAGRLEIICDTFLSVNTPGQIGLPSLLRETAIVRSAILGRVQSNYHYLQNSLRARPCSVLNSEGGWYAVIRFPRTRSDEEWALHLLQGRGIYTFPGFFFDFETEGYIIVSLLTDPLTFSRGVNGIVEEVSSP